MKLSEIAQYLDGQLEGEADIEIHSPAKIETAGKGQITFLANPKYQHFIEETHAGAIIIDHRIDKVSIPAIRVKDAYIGFVKVLNLFFPQKNDYITGHSQQAWIDPDAQVDPGAHIGPFVYIGPGAKVGKGSRLYPGVTLLKKTTVGEDCILYPSVTIREECVVGDRVILHNGCVIGSDGFGFAPKGDQYDKIPQMGRVVVEDDVEIGANSTIDRATLGDTVIKQGTKIDNLVQIAHNVEVGEHTVIAAQSGVAGSTKVGNNVTIAAQVGIVGHITVGDKSIIAAKSGVSKKVDDGVVVFGIPAQPIGRQKRVEASMRNLPEMSKRLRELEKEMKRLKELLESSQRSVNG